MAEKDNKLDDISTVSTNDDSPAHEKPVKDSFEITKRKRLKYLIVKRLMNMNLR